MPNLPMLVKLIARQAEIEDAVSRYIQENFTFTVIEVADKPSRLRLELRLISTISLCEECEGIPPAWPRVLLDEETDTGKRFFGKCNELYKRQLDADDLKQLETSLQGYKWPRQDSSIKPIRLKMFVGGYTGRSIGVRWENGRLYYDEFDTGYQPAKSAGAPMAGTN